MALFSRFKSIQASFMLAGHTKFKPDQVMAGMARAYYASDVFTIQEFANICQQYGQVMIIGLQTPPFPLRDIKRCLPLKYTSLPGE